MLNVTSNIESNERLSRLVIGAVLLVGALLDFGRFFLFLVGVILVVEGIIGWCGIPILVEKFKLNDLLGRKKQE